MDRNFVKSLALAALAASALATAASAGTNETGSLLVFPQYDNHRAVQTLLTVTNTNTDLDTGTVKVEFVYINGWNCQEFNRTRTLTPGDTLSVLSKVDNPNCVEGYMYAFAKHKTTGAAIKFDYLAGAALILNEGATDPDTLYTPYTFKAAAGLAEGANTDVDGDGLRDLNGNEYEKGPDQLIIPNFLAEDDTWESQLILINLSGGSQFTATVNFLVYNDNEEVFSAQTSFTCWKNCQLSHISNVFDDSFLVTTNQNPNEIQGGGPLPETGWFTVDGLVANSTAASIANPMILGMLIIHDDDEGGSALPYTRGQQDNGALLGHSIFP